MSSKRDAVPHERLQRAVDELLDDWLVEAAGEHGDAPPDAAGRSRELSHLRREEVAELVALGFEVAGVLVVRGLR